MDADTTSQVSQVGSSRGRGKNKRYWTPQEDEVLIHALHELALDYKWKSENGFRSGYMAKLEEMLHFKLPNCGLRAEPHIESRLKHWSENYTALAEMLSTSGFAWDDERKMLQTDKNVFDTWVKAHKEAKGLYGVPFPHYDILAEVYGKDRATGEATESFVDALNMMDAEIPNQVTIESDDDDTSSTIRSEKRPIKKEDVTQLSSKKAKKVKSKGKDRKNMDESDDLIASLHSVSNNFGKIFEDMNATLGTMANTWSKAEEREQELHEKSDNVLEEVLKLDGISPTETLNVATILMADLSKLRIFFQAPVALKKQYIMDILRKN